jgi:hypothetical protein
MAPRKYINKMVDAYTRMFGEPPKRKYSSPLEKGDHPETDISPLLDEEGITQYQSLIGMMQWAISLGRFDINTAVMTLSSFAMMPRQGHLDRAKRVCGYLWKMKHAIIRFRTGTPDYSDMTEQSGDWDYSVYGNNYKITPDDAPPVKGNEVMFTHYVDAYLYHDLITVKNNRCTTPDKPDTD